MAFGPDSNNPREQRAFTHAIRARATASPTPANRRAAIEQDIVLAQGPRKSRRMVAGLGSCTIDFVSGAYNKPGEKPGYLLSRDGSPKGPDGQENLVGVVRSNRPVADYRVGMGVHHDDRIADPRLVVGGEMPFYEALNSKILRDVGWDIHGEPYSISTRMMTIEQAAVAILRAQMELLPADINPADS